MRAGPGVLWAFFTQYNLRIWPMQLIAYVLCLVVVILALRKSRYSDQVITAVLAFFWLWLGLMLYLPGGVIFLPAYLFGALSLLQGGLFLLGVVRPNVSYRIGADLSSRLGVALIVYATVFYPLLGYAVGHIYPRSLTVGVFPCATAIFTLGLFLCSEGKVPRYLLIGPLAVALYGIVAVSTGVVEDVGLLIAGVLTPLMLVYRDRRPTPRPALRPTT